MAKPSGNSPQPELQWVEDLIDAVLAHGMMLIGAAVTTSIKLTWQACKYLARKR